VPGSAASFFVPFCG